MNGSSSRGLKSVMKASILFLLLCLTVSALSGCWDRREVESLGLVQVLGLDMGPGGKGVTISTTIAIPPKIVSSGGQGGGGGSETGAFTITMDGPTIYEAVNRINTTVNRDITLLQNSVVILGEDLAKKGVRNWMDTLVRFREMRRTELVFVAKGKAADIMAVQPKLEKNPAEYFRDLVGEFRRNGMFPMVRIQDFLNAFEAYAQEMYAPIIEKYHRNEPSPENKEKSGDSGGGSSSGDSGGGSPGDQKKNAAKPEAKDVRIAGTAIFKKDRWIGDFDMYETQALLLMLGQFHQGYLTINDPVQKNYFVGFRLIENSPPLIKYSGGKNGDRFRVKLKLEADLVSVQSGVDYTNPNLETKLARHIAATLKNRITKVLNKAQNQYNSDVFGLGTRVQETFLTDQDWVRYRWPDRFRDAQINLDVKVALRRVGVQFQPPEIR